jgi:hypothetical protein
MMLALALAMALVLALAALIDQAAKMAELCTIAFWPWVSRELVYYCTYI